MEKLFLGENRVLSRDLKRKGTFNIYFTDVYFL